ncbi:hypothetical protein ATANTOWER_004504, partial [Ataeniobius toweri]|nr:hypothetical protein [Ataeniobius toweri]
MPVSTARLLFSSYLIYSPTCGSLKLNLASSLISALLAQLMDCHLLLVLEFSGALDDRCFLSADCMEEYLSGRLPAFRRQSVCLSGFYLRL